MTLQPLCKRWRRSSRNTSPVCVRVAPPPRGDMPPKADRGAKCPQEGCSQRLNQATLGTCKGCGRDFCKNHCFPSDHDCQGPAAASLARSSSAPQLAKQPAAPGLGVLVSATKAARCALGHPGTRRERLLPDSQPATPALSARSPRQTAAPRCATPGQLVPCDSEPSWVGA